MKQYEPCTHCAEARTAGDLISAKDCPCCKGTGIRRVPGSYVCNKCGGGMCPEGTMNADNPHGLVEATVSGGYDSYHLLDTTTYEFSICEKCLREFFDSCKVPPSISFYMGGRDDDYTYADDRDAYRHRVWRDAGGDDEKLARGLCNVTIECESKATWRQFCSSSLTERAMCDAHRKRVRYANSYEVPAAWVEGVPVKPEERSPEQAKAVAHAWLRVAAVPQKITYFKFLGGCVCTHVGRDPNGATKEESTGGIWFWGNDVPEWAATKLTLHPFETGTLAVGSYAEVHNVVTDAVMILGRPNIVPAPVLPNLRSEDDGDDDSV